MPEIMFRNMVVLQFILMILPLVVAVVLHELAHGYVANRLGDPTARLAGRLTLNPIKHLDVFGSFLLPVALKLTGSPIIFGYAKPVPVNFTHLRPFRAGTIWVASAGVLTNMILAAISAALFQMIAATEASWVQTQYELLAVLFLQLLTYSVIINCVLALFNLIPIPPLDGSRIVMMLLPVVLRRPYARLERFGMIIIFVLLITGPLGRLMAFVLEPILDFLLGTS
ncbi:MAG: site-2 protease family protein [Desulfobacterales bacterium]